MKNVLKYLTYGLAVAGIITVVGAVGTMDYMLSIGEDYPIMETIKTIVFGVIMIIPSYVRFKYVEE